MCGHVVHSACVGKRWQRVVGCSDFASKVKQLKDGGYVLLVEQYTFTSEVGKVHKATVLKLDAEGNQKWVHSYGGTAKADELEEEQGGALFQVVELDDGSLILAGGEESDSFGSDDIWVVKLTSNGLHVWSKLFGQDADDEAADLIRTKAGKLESFKLYGNAHTQYGFAGDVDSTGGFLFAGQAFGFGAGKGDAFLVKTDAKGDAGGSCNTTSVALEKVNQASSPPKNKSITPKDFGGGGKISATLPGPGVPDANSTGICSCQ